MNSTSSGAGMAASWSAGQARAWSSASGEATTWEAGSPALCIAARSTTLQLALNTKAPGWLSRNAWAASGSYSMACEGGGGTLWDVVSEAGQPACAPTIRHDARAARAPSG